MGEFRAPQKTLAFFESGRIWSSPHGRARATGPAALFALRAVFEAAMLIYGDVYDALKPFSQKARGSRGRDPRNRRGAAVTSVHALVVRCPLLPLVKVVEIYIKKEEKLRCGRLRMLLAFFRRAVRAKGTRALLTVAVGMLVVLVNLLVC